MLKQSEATYQAIVQVLNSYGIHPAPGEDFSPYVPKSICDEVVKILMKGLRERRIVASNSLLVLDDKALRNYCVGLVRNWLRKDKRLNGGIQYRFVRKIKYEK
jgi:hypothetical protein